MKELLCFFCFLFCIMGLPMSLVFYFMEGKTLIESLKILIGAPLMVSILFYCLMRWPTATFIGCGILLTIGYSITGVK